MDSIQALDTICSIPVGATRFYYTGDSIIAVGQIWFMKVDSILVKLKENGLPEVSETLTKKKKEYFLPYYNADGTLQKIVQSTLDKSGKTFHTTIDSIIYLAGNIISYREVTDIPGRETATVYCSYYSDKLYKQDFSPTYKILSLSNGLSMRLFNVQPFCKNLLKSRGDFENYKYELDNEGKVTHMDVTFKSFNVFVWTNQYDYTYFCE
jgi:hypothetical protein